MFRISDLMLLSKSDLLPLLDDFDTDQAIANLRQLANPAAVFALSARRPETLDNWQTWLRDQLAQQRARVAQNQTLRPTIHASDTRLHRQA